MDEKKLKRIEARLEALEADMVDVKAALGPKIPRKKREPRYFEDTGWFWNQRQTGGCTHYWYLGKHFPGETKTRWIYIGKKRDPEIAREKIREWESKHRNGIEKSKRIYG